MLRYLTSGESHGRAIIGIIEGIPTGLSLDATSINKELARRQIGYGRGPRMKIEKDTAEILSGVRWGETIGSPITIVIKNRDWDNWQDGLSPEAGCKGSIPPVTIPRPGHADLSGAIKYAQKDIRNILERSSARETAVRVAIGAIAKRLIEEFNIKVLSHVIEIGGIKADLKNKSIKEIERNAERSDIRCADKTTSIKMKLKIDEAKKKGDSVGGVFEVIVTGIPVGLGSHVHWDRKLDARIAAAVMSIQAIKGVEIGAGFEVARKFGSKVHDEIFYQSPVTSHQSPVWGFYRKTNNAGGIEGGITNGENIIIRAAMKPIPTLKSPLKSVDIITKNSIEATYERSDICAVPAAGVIGEAVVAFVIADAMIEKFGGDSISEMKRNYDAYMKYMKGF